MEFNSMLVNGCSNMRHVVKSLIHLVSFCWRKLIFPLPGDISDNLAANLYPNC